MISTNNIKDSPISIGGEMTTKRLERSIFVQQDQQHISPPEWRGKNVTVEADRQRRTSGADPCGISVLGGPEGGDRVRTAIKNLGLSLPPKKITVNLSPADFRKEGTGFDLAIAAAILSSYGGFQAKDLEGCGILRGTGAGRDCAGIPGVMALTAQARESGFRRVFLPAENVKEASFIGGISLYGVWDLKHLVDMLSGKQSMRPEPPVNMKELQDTMNRYDVDFAELSGQPLLRSGGGGGSRRKAQPSGRGTCGGRKDHACEENADDHAGNGRGGEHRDLEDLQCERTSDGERAAL